MRSDPAVWHYLGNNITAAAVVSLMVNKLTGCRVSTTKAVRATEGKEHIS